MSKIHFSVEWLIENVNTEALDMGLLSKLKIFGNFLISYTIIQIAIYQTNVSKLMKDLLTIYINDYASLSQFCHVASF